MGTELAHNGWTVAMPILQVLGVIFAFLSGGFLARVFGVRPPKAPGPLPAGIPAREPRSAALPLPQAGSQLFGHEIKNYLCALKGNARLLRLAARSQDEAAIIDRIDRVVERLETFAFKEGSSPDVIRPAVRMTLDLREVAEACASTHFSRPGADFTFTASGSMPYIQGDPHRLEQVFMNLYGNALEAGARRIETRIRRIGFAIEIAVEDDGHGCARDQAARIFQPFFSTKPPQGSGWPGEIRPARGLGLFIVRSIVESHGGRIRASAKNGWVDGKTGLVVYLSFPLAASHPSPPSSRASASPATSFSVEYRDLKAAGAGLPPL